MFTINLVWCFIEPISWTREKHMEVDSKLVINITAHHWCDGHFINTSISGVKRVRTRV